MHLDAETVGVCVVKSVLGATWNLNKIIVKELDSVNCGIIWYLETLESRCETHAGVKLRQADRHYPVWCVFVHFLIKIN